MAEGSGRDGGAVRPLSVELDALDRRLLVELDADPLASFAALAERVASSPRTVSTRVHRLVRGGAVHIVGRTLPGFGGRVSGIARFAVRPADAESLARAMAARPSTSWVRLSSSGTEIMCGVVEPSSEPVTFRRLAQEPRVDDARFHQFLRVWGSREAVVRARTELDDLDRGILALLARDGRLDVRSMAARLGVDASTVTRRRARLVDQGVLYFEADVHPEALLASAQFMAWIAVRPGAIGRVGAALRRQSQTRFVAATSGRTQIVANLVVADPADVVEFLDDRLTDLPVGEIDLVPMGRVLKRTSGLDAFARPARR